MGKYFLSVLIILVLGACRSFGQDPVLIENVSIVNVRTGDIEAGRWVLIEEGIIRQIFRNAPNQKIENSIDGSGKFLMPGLAEMHAHIPSSDWGRKDAEETLFLYLSNGITTIRGMLGHPEHLDLREKARKNEIISPRIFTSSPSLNGNTVPTAEEARKKVSDYDKAGYDFLKIHPGIKRGVFDVIVEEANTQDIPFAGHVPVDVGIVHALESKYASIDHIDGFIEGLVPPSADANPEQNGFFGYNFTDLADVSRLNNLIELARVNEVWVVCTQSLFERWFSPTDPAVYLKEPEMKYMPASVLDTWVRSKKQLLSDPGYSAEKWKEFNDIRRNMIAEIQKNGYGLLLGSDAPQVFNVPGFSIHHEMKGMLDAGLSPLEVIQAGTLNPARFFGAEGEFGEVRQGASADLLLIDGNPLLDLNAVRNPAYVFVRGRVLDRTMIEKRLDEIAESAGNQ